MANTGIDAKMDAGTAEVLRQQLRALIDSLEDVPHRGDAWPEQVLMGTDCDGERYILIRMPGIDRKSASLSPREIEIVRLVAAGHPNKVIADVLEISSWTVCTHMRRVFAKLGVNSRAAMVARIGEFTSLVDVARSPAPDPARKNSHSAPSCFTQPGSHTIVSQRPSIAEGRHRHAQHSMRARFDHASETV